MRQLLAALLVLGWIGSASGQTVAPVPFPAFTNATGGVCSSCRLETYAAGTSTPLVTYQDAGLTTQHQNPIVLTTAGRPTAPIYFSQSSYKLILKTAGGSTIWTADNVAPVPTTLTGVSSSTDVEFRVDTDNNGTNVFSFLSGTNVQVGALNESGNLQLDGTITERGRAFAMGEWTTPTFAAGNFTANTGTWTVDSGDVGTFAYTVLGKTMVLSFVISTTDVSASATQLRVAIPGGFVAAKSFQGAYLYIDAGTTQAAGRWFVSAAGTDLNFEKLTGTWTITAADDTHVRGVVTFEVQ